MHNNPNQNAKFKAYKVLSSFFLVRSWLHPMLFCYFLIFIIESVLFHSKHFHLIYSAEQQTTMASSVFFAFSHSIQFSFGLLVLFEEYDLVGSVKTEIVAVNLPLFESGHKNNNNVVLRESVYVRELCKSYSSTDYSLFFPSSFVIAQFSV